MGDDDIEQVALEMIGRFGGDAARIARELAEIADVLPDMPSAEAWRDIADAIDRLLSKP